MGQFYPGDRVLARWHGDHLWFPGTVHSVGGDGSPAIAYDDGTSEIRPADEVRPFDWQVGSAVDAIWSGNGDWYAAKIVALGADGRMLTVRFDDDGIVEETDTGRCRSE